MNKKIFGHIFSTLVNKKQNKFKLIDLAFAHFYPFVILLVEYLNIYNQLIDYFTLEQKITGFCFKQLPSIF